MQGCGHGNGLFETWLKFCRDIWIPYQKRMKCQADGNYTLLNVSRAFISNVSNEIRGERKGFFKYWGKKWKVVTSLSLHKYGLNDSVCKFKSVKIHKTLYLMWWTILKHQPNSQEAKEINGFYLYSTILSGTDSSLFTMLNRWSLSFFFFRRGLLFVLSICLQVVKLNNAFVNAPFFEW